MQFLANIWRMIMTAFGIGGNNTHLEAWVDGSEILSPREALIARVNKVVQFGAMANFAVVIAIIVIILVTGSSSDTLGGILLANAGLAPDSAVLVSVLGVLSNATVLLLLAAGAQAQEFWTLPLLVFALIANLLALFMAGFLLAIIAIIPLVITAYLALRDLRAFHGNPVTIKELRGRMRGVRSFAIITIFLILMGSFTVLLYLLQLPTVTGGRTVVTGELGRILFIGVVGIELMLIIFIVPALTAGAVTGERERKTYDLLQTTLLSAPSFLVGKMESALGYILLLLLSAIPLQSIAFLFGGVSETEVGIAFVILTTTGLVLGAAGLFFSAQTERTLTSTVRVYTAAMIVTFAVPLAAFFLFGNAFSNAIAGVANNSTATPLAEAASIYGDMIAASLNPITAALYTQQILIDHQQTFILSVQLASDGSSIPVVSPWVLLTILYLLATALLILMGVRRMRQGE